MSRRVAVIGSGMGGLAAAHFCRRAGLQVTVFEALPGHGMDAHALRVHEGLVDVPLRVMSPDSWASVLALAAEVGVGTFGVDTYVSCSSADGRTWFRSGRMPFTGWPFVGAARYLNLRSLTLARELRRLSRATARLAAGDHAEDTLACFLEREGFDPLFWRGLALPLLVTICTCDETELLHWPALQLLERLQDILHGPRLVRLQGGTSALVQGLARDLDCLSGSPVVTLTEAADGRLEVRNARGEGGPFDRVIVATQANQLGFLADTPYAGERERLAGIPYATGELVVHTDPRLLPARRADWTALNLHADASAEQPTWTVWVNAVEPTLADQPPVFQSWNPPIPPADDQVIERLTLQRAVVSTATAGLLETLERWHAEPDRRLFYCGSWACEGVPLLETAVRSARLVVDRLSASGADRIRRGP